MLTTKQSKLLKLAEECAEVAQQAAKQMHFGRDHVQEGHSVTSGERLRDEMLDVLVVAKILVTLGEMAPISETDIQEHFQAKLPKIERYTWLSFDRGQIETPWIPLEI